MAGFQKRSLSALSHAWNGDGADAFAVAADTGSGKTEAAALPLIAAAAADRLHGMMGVRAILAYPRIRLAANQAQRLAQYLDRKSVVSGKSDSVSVDLGSRRTIKKKKMRRQITQHKQKNTDKENK